MVTALQEHKRSSLRLASPRGCRRCGGWDRDAGGRWRFLPLRESAFESLPSKKIISRGRPSKLQKGLRRVVRWLHYFRNAMRALYPNPTEALRPGPGRNGLSIPAELTGKFPKRRRPPLKRLVVFAAYALLAAASSASLNAVAPDAPEDAASSAALPVAPEPVAAGGIDHYAVAPAATWHQIPFSRVGIGADLSPLGIGIKGAIVLNHYFDARLMGNFFSYNHGRFEIEGFNVHPDVHLASGAAALDFYPFGSVFRISPGVLFANGNQVSGIGTIAPGTSFSIESRNYYSANPNPVTGATPLMGTGKLGLHSRTPAITATGGFGKFIPRSNRHWSFPSEFGVAFTGAPTIDVNVTGWACLDAKQTQCGNVGDPTNAVGVDFNNDLQERLAKWRNSLNRVKVYPLFSYSVVYSFNIR